MSGAANSIFNLTEFNFNLSRHMWLLAAKLDGTDAKGSSTLGIPRRLGARSQTGCVCPEGTCAFLGCSL